MDILNIKLVDCKNLVLSINLYAVIVLVLLTALVAYCLKKIYNKTKFKTIKIEEATIGIGNSSVTIKYDGRIKEIAYKIWIELTTRKIGIRFDEKNDVISEVYDSWYDAFKVIRLLLEDVPADRINNAKGLVELTTKVLNDGLRPHLTIWQAKYRSWYACASDKFKDMPPQEVQRNFPEYDMLVSDLKHTNDIMIKYAIELKRLIDNE